MCLNSPTLPFLPCFITFCSTHSYTSYFYEIFATCANQHRLSFHFRLLSCIDGEVVILIIITLIQFYVKVNKSFSTIKVLASLKVYLMIFS